VDKRQPQKNLLQPLATRSVAGTMEASETSAPEKDLAAKSAIGWGGASILVSKDPLMYPSMRCPELSIPDCTNNTRVAPNAEPRKSGSGMNLCLASIRTTLGQKGLRAATALPAHVPKKSGRYSRSRASVASSRNTRSNL